MTAKAAKVTGVLASLACFALLTWAAFHPREREDWWR